MTGVQRLRLRFAFQSLDDGGDVGLAEEFPPCRFVAAFEPLLDADRFLRENVRIDWWGGRLIDDRRSHAITVSRACRPTGPESRRGIACAGRSGNCPRSGLR